MKNKKLLSLLIIILSVICDRITKFFASTVLKEHHAGNFDIIEDVLSLTYHENRGAAFGIFSNARWIFMSVSTIAIIAILIYIFIFKENSYTTLISLALIAGGGIGNMIDRISLGYVIDFIYVRIIDFPIFNVADICVTCGAFLLIVYLIFFSKEGDLQGTT